MSMQNVLQKIKDAEALAEQMVASAKAEVAKRLEKIELESQSMVQRAVSQAKHKADQIIEQGTAAAAAKAHEVALRSEEECTKLRANADTRLGAAVKLVRERVMTHDGRS